MGDMYKRLARSVQDEVVHRRGGEPPSYTTCLREVKKEFEALRGEKVEGGLLEIKALVVERVSARLR